MVAGTCLMVCGLVGCRDARPQETILQGEAMGTTWRLRYAGETVAGLDGRVTRRLDELEAIFSTWREGSVISRLNRGEEVALPDEFRRVSALAAQIGEMSGGVFDVELGESVEAAGFGSGLGGRLDYSGIAKGFAADEVGALLESLGIDTFLFELGGELLGRGAREWRVGLESPEPGAIGELRRVIPLQDQAVATSGTYRLFRGTEHHLIDPRSRQPVAHDCVSVSVIAESCAEADAFATALIVLGAEQGLVLARRLGLRAYFVRRLSDGTLIESVAE